MVQKTKATFVLRLGLNPPFCVQIRANNVGVMYEICRKRHSYTYFNRLTVNGLSQNVGNVGNFSFFLETFSTW